MKTISKTNYTEKMIKAFSKLAVNKQLSSLRDGFAFITPLLIVGALGVVFVVFIFGGWGSNNASLLGLIARIDASVNGTTLAGVTIDSNNILSFNANSAYQTISNIGVKIFEPLWSATVSGALSIYTSFTIGYFYSRTRNASQPIITGLLCMVTFFIVTGFDSSLFGPNGSLISIIITFITVEIYIALEKLDKLKLKMPNGVPPAVAVSFSKLFPLMITAGGMALVNAPFIIMNQIVGTDASSFGKAIYLALQAPFISLATNPSGQLGIGILFVTLVCFFWFFGLHGSNILDGAVNPIWFVLLALNTEELSRGQIPSQAMAKGFWDAYIYVGGTGCTLGLLIATLFFSKRKDTIQVAKFSLPAGLFQINEPVTFGYPMVLNPTFFIPYIFLMPVLTVISWAAISILKWVPGGIVAIPWSTPMLLGAFLHSGSWQGIILALLNLIISIVVYVPFVLIYNKAIDTNNSLSVANKIFLFGKLKKENRELKEKIKLLGVEKLQEYENLNDSLKLIAKNTKLNIKQEIKNLKLEYEQKSSDLNLEYVMKYNDINNVIRKGHDMSDDEYLNYLKDSDIIYNEYLSKIEQEKNDSLKSKNSKKENVKNLKAEMYYKLDVAKNNKIVDQSSIDNYYEKISSLWVEHDKKQDELKQELENKIKKARSNKSEYNETLNKINEIKESVNNEKH